MQKAVLSTEQRLCPGLVYFHSNHNYLDIYKKNRPHLDIVYWSAIICPVSKDQQNRWPKSKATKSISWQIWFMSWVCGWSLCWMFLNLSRLGEAQRAPPPGWALRLLLQSHYHLIPIEKTEWGMPSWVLFSSQTGSLYLQFWGISAPHLPVYSFWACCARGRQPWFVFLPPGQVQSKATEAARWTHLLNLVSAVVLSHY